MLIRFEASNFRSIAAPAELSMVAVDRDRIEARGQSAIGESLLPLAAIYGPNASGKSNVIAAFSWLCDAISSSLRLWEDSIPIEPFAFGDGPTRASSFAVELMVDDVRFEYIVELNRESVLYEGLFHYPEKRPRRIFEREGDEFKIQRGLGAISGTRELLTGQTLALSIARRFGEPLVSRFTSKLLQAQFLGRRPPGRRLFRSLRTGNRSTLQMFEDRTQLPLFSNEDVGAPPDPRSETRKKALALLQLADLGIDDVLVEREESTSGSSESYSALQVRMVHRTTSGPFPLDLGVESEGTRTWFNLIGPMLRALETGSLLLFDELDASLHPTLSAQVLQFFHNPTTNPLGAQLIFTSHDTSLLNHLNRDEVWLTSKEDNGSTHLGALAEFAGERVRRSKNLETGYLHGRFGALPKVDQAEFLRALGLIG